MRNNPKRSLYFECFYIGTVSDSLFPPWASHAACLFLRLIHIVLVFRGLCSLEEPLKPHVCFRYPAVDLPVNNEAFTAARFRSNQTTPCCTPYRELLPISPARSFPTTNDFPAVLSRQNLSKCDSLYRPPRYHAFFYVFRTPRRACVTSIPIQRVRRSYCGCYCRTISPRLGFWPEPAISRTFCPINFLRRDNARLSIQPRTR